MTQIQAVVFDIGNVLINWAPERMFDREIGRERRERLFQEVDLAEMNDRVDLGADFDAAVEAKAAQHPNWRDEIILWRDNWIEMASPAIGHSAALLQALQRNGVPVFSLSNFGIRTFEIARARYPVLNSFDRQFISGHLGMMKPDPAIYDALEKATEIPPSRLLFTDDRPDNIEAARERGWQVHLFEQPQSLADRLVAEGLLTAMEARP